MRTGISSTPWLIYENKHSRDLCQGAMDFEHIFSFDRNRTQSQCVDHEVRRPICMSFCEQFFSDGRIIRLTDQRNAILAIAVPANRDLLIANVCTCCASTVWPSGLRRWLQAPVRKGVGSNPTAVTLLTNGILDLERVKNQGILSGTPTHAAHRRDPNQK